MSITVGSSSLTVSALGRIFAPGDTGSHTVKIVNAANSQDVSGGSATVSMSDGTAGNFVYANLPATVTLSANTSYYILSQETAGGDQWYDVNTTIQTTNVASETSGVWSPDGANYNLFGTGQPVLCPVGFSLHCEHNAAGDYGTTAEPDSQRGIDSHLQRDGYGRQSDLSVGVGAFWQFVVYGHQWSDREQLYDCCHHSGTTGPPVYVHGDQLGRFHSFDRGYPHRRGQRCRLPIMSPRLIWGRPATTSPAGWA